MDTFKQTLDPVMYLPMVEAAGTIASDISGNNINGAYVNTPTLQNLTLPDGSKIPLFDGTEEVTFWSAAFRDAFNGNTGSILAICKVADVEWEDGSSRILLSIRGSSDILTISKQPAYYTMAASRMGQQGYFNPSGKGDVMMLCITWDHSANQFLVYADGELSFPLTAPEWTEITSSTYTRIGRSSSAASDYWLGNAGHVGITDKCLSASEVRALFAELYPTTESIFIIGDSKSVGAVGGWRSILLQGIETAEGVRQVLRPTLYNIGGYDVGEMKAYIDAHLAAETATPTKILINLGANDIPEPTPEVQFKSEYKSIIDSVKAKFPGVSIYLATILRNDTAQNITNCAIINGYISDLVTSESVNAGLDEAGLTLADGVHYAGSDMATVASRWLTAIGY